MKIILLLALTCLGAKAANSAINLKTDTIIKYHNKIDDISSEKEIETLLVMIDVRYKNFRVNNPIDYKFGFKDKSDTVCRPIDDSLKPKPWVKVDFDGNGYTDLLVIGWRYNNSVLCIMDKGANNFIIITLTRRSFQDCTFPIVSSIDNNPVILNYYMHEPDWDNRKFTNFLKADTLIFRFGDFVEYKSKPAQHKIEKIEFKTGSCYGTCPIFRLTIQSNRVATLIASKYNRQKGKYSTTIDSSHFNQLVGILNYINFETLRNDYSVNWTDAQNCTLKITYNGGKTKFIHDYGLIGTFGLNGTYRILFRLRDNQKWKRKWI